MENDSENHEPFAIQQKKRSRLVKDSTMAHKVGN